MKRLALGIFIGILSLIFIAGFTSCKEEQENPGTDQELYELAKLTVGYHWFNNSDAFQEAGTGTGHGLPYQRTRFDAVASDFLDTQGRVMEGASFAEGSVIVKELYDSSEVLKIYAVRLKETGHPDADSKGWVWGYLNSDGSVIETAENKGAMCISCHSQAGSIDYVLLNKFVPDSE